MTEAHSRPGALWWTLLAVAILFSVTAQLSVRERSVQLLEQQQTIDELRGQVADLRVEVDSLRRESTRRPTAEISVGTVRETWQRSELARLRRGPPWEGISQEAPGRFSLERATVERARRDTDLVSREARIAPRFDGERLIGFRLFSIQPEGLFDLVGLEDEDVVTELGGVQLTDASTFLDTVAEVTARDRFAITLLRGGDSVTFEYRVLSP